MNSQIHPRYHSFEKRLFDIVLACIGILFSLPIWITVLPIILITSGFPLIFQQKRSGKNNQPFTMYKLRTMKRDAWKEKTKYGHLNQAPEPMFKIFDDPRFEGIGKFLSKTGLDETPQFINILKGEMSFIGPRPLPIEEAQKLPSSWNFRFAVKPGLFSEWTVSKERHTSLKIWKELEKMTVEKSSFKEDFLLIIKVVTQILSKHFSFFKQ